MSRASADPAPFVEVLVGGIGWDPERPHADVDLLACGHALTGATDRIGRRYPARRRCRKCARGLSPHIDDATMEEARIIAIARKAARS